MRKQKTKREREREKEKTGTATWTICTFMRHESDQGTLHFEQENFMRANKRTQQKKPLPHIVKLTQNAREKNTKNDMWYCFIDIIMGGLVYIFCVRNGFLWVLKKEKKKKKISPKTKRAGLNVYQAKEEEEDDETM